MKNDKKQKQRKDKGEHGEKRNLSTFALCRFVFPRVYGHNPKYWKTGNFYPRGILSF